MAALVGQTLARAGRHQVSPALGTTVCVSKRDSSSQIIYRGQSADTAAYKRGTGGRSSFSGHVTTVFGATGFLGRYVVNRLGKIGSQVIIPYRGDPYEVRERRLAGDLGQVLFMPYNLRDEDALRKSMEYSNVVVNLIGSEYKTKNFTLEDTNVDGCRRIARIARECGVEKLVHFSHLNAVPELRTIFAKKGSGILRSKFKGEMAVREEFPDAIVFRPADMFGAEDRFITYYNARWRRTFSTNVQLWRLGKDSIKQPVYVSDVAHGVINAILKPESEGVTYDCVGPRAYFLADLVDYIHRLSRRFTARRARVKPTLIMKAMFCERVSFGRPTITLDRLDMEHQNDVVRGELTLKDLDVPLTYFEDRAPFELRPYSMNRDYDAKINELAVPDPPPYILQ